MRFKIKREKRKQREVEEAWAKERYGRHAWSRRRPVRKQTDCFAGSFVMRPWHINYFPTGSYPPPSVPLIPRPCCSYFFRLHFFLRLLNDYRAEKHANRCTTIPFVALFSQRLLPIRGTYVQFYLFRFIRISCRINRSKLPPRT